MDTRKWKRSFMNAEHRSRAMKRKLEARMFEMELKEIRSRREIKQLKSRLSNRQNVIQNQFGVIERLQKALKDNNIPQPTGTQIASFKMCNADDDEVCPLSLQYINDSLPPYDSKYPEIVIEAHKPHHKCAELICGHRFNALWLLFHFVARSTFSCPMCRQGHKHFTFEVGMLPSGLLERINEMMEKK